MYDVTKIITIADGPTKNRKQVTVKYSDFVPAGITRIKELLKLIDSKLGGVKGWRELGVNQQMRFAIAHGISDAELPMIDQAFYAIPPEGWDLALKPVWELAQAELRVRFEDLKTDAEAKLFMRAWALDCTLALFMRSLKTHAATAGFLYDTDLDRDLRFKKAWIPMPTEDGE